MSAESSYSSLPVGYVKQDTDSNSCDETDAMNKSVRTSFETEATVKGVQKLSLHASVEQLADIALWPGRPRASICRSCSRKPMASISSYSSGMLYHKGFHFAICGAPILEFVGTYRYKPRKLIIRGGHLKGEISI